MPERASIVGGRARVCLCVRVCQGCVWALDHTLHLLEVPPASLLDLGSPVRPREACTAQERRGWTGPAFVGRQPHLCRAPCRAGVTQESHLPNEPGLRSGTLGSGRNLEKQEVRPGGCGSRSRRQGGSWQVYKGICLPRAGTGVEPQTSLTRLLSLQTLQGISALGTTCRHEGPAPATLFWGSPSLRGCGAHPGPGSGATVSGLQTSPS